MGLIGSTLERWRRSVGDFHSAVELDASNGDAKINAEVVERKIADLLKFKKQLEEQGEQVASKREDIKEMMKKMRGKIPKEMQRESDEEEDDDDEEKQDEPKPGEKQQQRIGSDREVSPDMARWLKETMKRRTMSLGTKQEGEGFKPTEEQRKPQQRKGRTGDGPLAPPQLMEALRQSGCHRFWRAGLRRSIVLQNWENSGFAQCWKTTPRRRTPHAACGSAAHSTRFRFRPADVCVVLVPCPRFSRRWPSREACKETVLLSRRRVRDLSPRLDFRAVR